MYIREHDEDISTDPVVYICGGMHILRKNSFQFIYLLSHIYV